MPAFTRSPLHPNPVNHVNPVKEGPIPTLAAPPVGVESVLVRSCPTQNGALFAVLFSIHTSTLPHFAARSARDQPPKQHIRCLWMGPSLWATSSETN